ncbi:MAG: putative disulfide formation protein [Candidatus Kaiserbacteria bacterium GW2011_GWB1_52_6]|uniref:Putative disulfide formation protein n=3 Tax=Candidatus Kaiseribacteriota TaxID=1752734 RepID=A0A0G1XHE3_9BACT|nr:MAG: putative disulfide formation protein [Candidatus Kaiserbacteria bacterium GW2011_GWA2_52_12]KKW27014.1 MAG: putative disulfide formation protein [Candidatus Kaiserbacteria bacterium GW2011_GWB1_52_6]KKW30330.1 MAG: putative disulfide formation protein [Candidatus Kaiserbacteria bacterium GW2011_GWC2_52_8b]
MSVETLNYLVALVAVVLQIITVALFLAYLLRKQYTFLDDVIRPVGEWGIWIGFLTVLGAMGISLYYSEILGFEPCPLCWWIRVFMYSQAVLFAVALWRKDTNVTMYSIALSVIGFTVALYNHALQVLPSGSLPCPASGTVSCAQRIIFEFGYITFPLLGATLFAFLIIVMLIVRRRA